MKNVPLAFVVLILTSCGGGMSDEQRKQMLEAKEQQKIQKISEAEILDLGIAQGRKVVEGLTVEDASLDLDSLSNVAGMKIHWLAPGKMGALAIEQQLIDAYLNSLIEGTPLNDNIQKIGIDSLLYTKPVVLMRPDSIVEIKGTWNIWMSKKQLILSRGKK